MDLASAQAPCAGLRCVTRILERDGMIFCHHLLCQHHFPDARTVPSISAMIAAPLIHGLDWQTSSELIETIAALERPLEVFECPGQ